MSTTTRTTQHWMPAEEMRELGFMPAGPEIDYGMRWGESATVRVSYAPLADRGEGFLYAYDKESDHYLLLATRTTPEAVDAAWRQLNACTSAPDAYLALAVLDEQPLPFEQARALLLHCVDREFAAYRDFSASGVDTHARVESAHAVVVQRSARVAAEQILLGSSAAADPDRPPVVIRYRLPNENGWTGRVSGFDLDSATTGLREVNELARKHGLVVQATSVTQGRSTVAAARVPELHFAAVHASLTPDAPQLGI